MFDMKLNPKLSYQLIHVGTENTPVIIIDDLVENIAELLSLAGNGVSSGFDYQNQHGDFYPGIRKSSPEKYQHNICLQLLPLLNSPLNLQTEDKIDVIMSAFSIATTLPENLRPIQMLPHFDTPADNQFAIVHYLCDKKHGGTSFYRHKKTGFERVTEQRNSEYLTIIKQQAIAEKLHNNPKYIEGDTSLFEQMYSVEAKMNRAVIYPSNVLHSGNIRPNVGLCSAPALGRLTISSFLLIKSA
jgi:hypothetical protein